MKLLIPFLSLLTLTFCGPSGSLPKLERSVDSATVKADGNLLTVSTGAVKRQWRWTGKGLVTTGLVDLESGRDWASTQPAVASDWSYAGLIDDTTVANLVSLNARESTDEGFTSKHLEVAAEIDYLATGVSIRYLIWAYPGAPGIRTQIYLKRAGEAFAAPANPAEGESTGRVDYVPAIAAARRYIGYYNDTQHRNTPETPILEEETAAGVLSGEEVNSWASIACLEDGGDGLCLVKESHKCVNQTGVDTGAFLADAAGIRNTGTSLLPGEINENYRWWWAGWTVAYRGGDDGRELAIKQFDRTRFPVDADRDMFIKSNIWGHSKDPRDGRDQAAEKKVLAEMTSAAGLGLDLFMIDDGWQVSPQATGADPDGGNGWKPHPSIYPEGWKNIVARAAELNLRLGVWAVAMKISLEEMKWNFDEAGFVSWKLDFARLNNHDEMESTMDKVRQFILYTRQQARMTWDTTENAPRYGYYWAREYGNMHFMNRKPDKPVNVVYVPWLCLRDSWLLAKYNNLNKWQLVVHNIDTIGRENSDAWKHNHLYALAIAMMGSPVFFQITQYYDEADRQQIRPLLKLYQEHQRSIFNSYVYPIGDQPTNASWSGFPFLKYQ
jgi:hypothetical protein